MGKENINPNDSENTSFTITFHNKEIYLTYLDQKKEKARFLLKESENELEIINAENYSHNLEGVIKTIPGMLNFSSVRATIPSALEKIYELITIKGYKIENPTQFRRVYDLILNKRT